ncbi:hypothetical protein ACIBVL_25505 [Streptomyces sp. NPDC049687]|uniref:hypothetical protein n=1 Tax=Streptomyces sp. NPDC049687 TaxID=3365596 RepID=UPI0037B27CDD
MAAYHMLSHDEPYHDLGPDHVARRLSEESRRRRLVTQLDALGCRRGCVRTRRVRLNGCSATSTVA